MKDLTMTIEKQLGMRIRFLRKQRNLSIEDLALEAGVNKNYLSDLERGQRNPSLKILSKIAVALKISISETSLFTSESFL